MKSSYISSTNVKGQIVIPKSLRDELDITPQTLLNITCSGEGLYLHPIESVINRSQTKIGGAYLALLKATVGAWKNETWSELRKKRKKIESLN